MDRARRVAELWGYLPAFRAAGETEHLPSAGRALFLSPSALSRAVKILESSLGVSLFDRIGRGIALNPRGRALLVAVRDAMRLVDEAVAALESDEVEGEVAIAAPRELAPVLMWPVLGALAERYPRLVPRLSVLDPTQVRELLLRGEIDLALTDRALPPDRELSVERVARLSHSVFAPPGHALAGRRTLDPREVARHGFAVPRPAASDAMAPDHWPPELTRTRLIWVPDVAMAADACAELGVLAVLPDLVGQRHPAGLTPLPMTLGPHAVTDLYVVTRAPVHHHVRTDAALEAIRARAAALDPAKPSVHVKPATP